MKLKHQTESPVFETSTGKLSSKAFLHSSGGLKAGIAEWHKRRQSGSGRITATVSLEFSCYKIHNCARRMQLRNSTMPYTRLRRMDYHENGFAVKPQPKFLNGASQQTQGKQQEQHEPGKGVEGVVEQQPSERSHQYRTDEVNEEGRCSITRRSTAARWWCLISETQQQEMQEQAADLDDGGDGVSFKG